MQNINNFETSFAIIVCNGIESISYLIPKIWYVIPEEYKKLNDLNSFKESNKNGYSLIFLADFVKPMQTVLVF